ncbi:MAG: alpha/beta hydrolase [Chloroflexota bacterium]|nr:MAG: alpha/beta hydrolase [Chloroflexota bacterium]
MDAKQTKVAIPCGSIFLEGVLHEPVGAARRPGVVVCHPHPMFGGDMTNSVVVSLVSALVGTGIVALRFNFRGTGRSGGMQTGGEREPEDVRAALSFLQEQPGVDAEKLGLAGYSFGAAMGLRVAAQDERVKAFVSVSLPYIEGSDGSDPISSATDDPAVLACTKPRLFIVGDRDQFAPLSSFRARLERFRPPYRIEVIPGADHFWLVRAGDAAEKAAEYMNEILLGTMV